MFHTHSSCVWQRAAIFQSETRYGAHLWTWPGRSKQSSAGRLLLHRWNRIDRDMGREARTKCSAVFTSNGGYNRRTHGARHVSQWSAKVKRRPRSEWAGRQKEEQWHREIQLRDTQVDRQLDRWALFWVGKQQEQCDDQTSAGEHQRRSIDRPGRASQRAQRHER